MSTAIHRERTAAFHVRCFKQAELRILLLMSIAIGIAVDLLG